MKGGLKGWAGCAGGGFNQEGAAAWKALAALRGGGCARWCKTSFYLDWSIAPSVCSSVTTS